jgi:hypothetical protein
VAGYVVLFDGIQVEVYLQHRTVEVSRSSPAGVGQDAQHEVVLRQDVGHKVMHPALPGDTFELAKQRGTDAAQVLL